MTNEEVITDLKRIIAELERRKRELEALEKKLPGPPADIPAQLNAVFKEKINIIASVKDLKLRLNRRETAKSLKQNVPALSNTRKAKMKDALTKVSKSISEMATFQSKLQLASDIVKAANDADAASVVG